MGGKNQEMSESSFALDMTPMIDAVFNLLISFLCNINFRLLEGKIPAYLPKDVGVSPTPIDTTLEKVDIQINRAAMPDVRSAWTWNENQIAISVQGKRCTGLRDFHETIRRVHDAYPDAKATFHPGKGTLYIDSVKVINECLRANFVDITFAGTTMDG